VEGKGNTIGGKDFELREGETKKRLSADRGEGGKKVKTSIQGSIGEGPVRQMGKRGGELG